MADFVLFGWGHFGKSFGVAIGLETRIPSKSDSLTWTWWNNLTGTNSWKLKMIIASHSLKTNLQKLEPLLLLALLPWANKQKRKRPWLSCHQIHATNGANPMDPNLPKIPWHMGQEDHQKRWNSRKCLRQGRLIWSVCRLEDIFQLQLLCGCLESRWCPNWRVEPEKF